MAAPIRKLTPSKAEQNQTTIKTKHPKETTVESGLVLLRFASVQEQLVIEH